MWIFEFVIHENLKDAYIFWSTDSVKIINLLGTYLMPALRSLNLDREEHRFYTNALKNKLATGLDYKSTN